MSISRPPLRIVTATHSNGTAGRGSKPFLAEVRPDHYEVIAHKDKPRSEPRVSVIIPTRDRRELLSQALAALRDQDLRDDAFEVIVVDNSSEDGTSELLRETARTCNWQFTAVRMRQDRGPAVARNVGATLAQAPLLAFTDSDCLPDRGWLRGLLLALADDVTVVQGWTGPPPSVRQPLFNHFVNVREVDGTFCTSNILYRTDALREAGGFDPDCDYWEDVDLGWRVLANGGTASFAEDAKVYHQVMPLPPLRWLRQASRIYNLPIIVSRYPGFRRHLTAGIWTSPWNLLFQLALAGGVLGAFKREFFLMAVPYLVSFPFRGRLVGKAPPLRAAAHIARDAVSFGALLAGSIKSRKPVL